MGFVNRTGIKEYESFVRFAPRPQNHPLIRQFQWNAGFSQTSDSRNVMLSQNIRFGLFQINFHSGERFIFNINREFERLERDFRMGPDDTVLLEAGNQYRYHSYEFNWNMSNQRPVSLSGQFRWGDYFSGTRRNFRPRLTLRPRNGLVISMENEWTRIELPEGSFSVSVFVGETSFQFSPWMSLANNIQYDNDSRNLGW